ncbi:hypothetical protein HR11_00335 [Porphyromonas macacae]|uniref:Positive regulator of sigma E activity n=1 Tax=Porphyromonas macacae TaxID=28115 RepID=A0A379DHM2_9PORP|nr:SoxR reducing system RseC family protein [Porphyromonas macacae]KGO00374.1 hypothetical protein HR11_00335 [Porphyromonas macacae]SUB77831.1 Positive regulator of sigma E activity [Porphyromonas macacae]
MKQELLSVGKVSRVVDGVVSVLVEQRSACAGCHAAGFCSSADCKERILDINTPSGDFKPGDMVNIYAVPSMGRKAVLLSFVIPILLLLITVFVCTLFFRLNDGISALMSLVSVTVYYLLLRLAEPRLRNTMRYSIEKINA